MLVSSYLGCFITKSISMSDDELLSLDTYRIQIFFNVKVAMKKKSRLLPPRIKLRMIILYNHLTKNIFFIMNNEY